MAKRKKYVWKLGEPPPTIDEHSLAKLDIVEQYVGIYIDRVTRAFGQTLLNLTIVDGFCGGGLYRDGTGFVDGSPLRLLKAVEDAERELAGDRRKGFVVRADFVFVDENPDHVAFLRDLLVRRGYLARLEKDIFLRCSTFEDAQAEVVARIHAKGPAQRALFFLDQYGWSNVRFATLRQILGTLAKPEILLTFAVDALIDFLSSKRSETRALFGIDLDREDVRALEALKDEQGWRFLIQHGLYRHVQESTGALFYTPFFIHSPKSHRSYWLIHLSNHRQARDEMGKLHWQIQNHFMHHGGAGFGALGFDPDQDLRQGLFDFVFDDGARAQSEKAVLAQLPELLWAERARSGDGLPMEAFFAARCNDTAVTSEILQSQLVHLRDEKEIEIVGANGKPKPRATRLDWGDRILLPSQGLLFSRWR